MPEPYAPPVQRQPFENGRTHQVMRIVEMTNGDANAHIAQDIPVQPPGPWRWTGQKPTVKVNTSTNLGWRFIIDFSLPVVTMKVTGPVAMTFLVNDHPLDTIHYDKAGEYHYEKAVPPEWIEPSKDTLLAANIDKVYLAKNDGAKLGFILVRIGLTQ